MNKADVLKALFSAIEEKTADVGDHPEDVLSAALHAVEGVYSFIAALPLGSFNYPSPYKAQPSDLAPTWNGLRDHAFVIGLLGWCKVCGLGPTSHPTPS